MKPSDKSYLNAKFSLIMAFVMQILANQTDNTTVKWILTIAAIVEIVIAVFELVSMVRWQKAEEKCVSMRISVWAVLLKWDVLVVHAHT